MAEASDLLTLINAVIAKRLRGDAYERYVAAEQDFYGMPLDKLFEMRS